MRRPIRLFSIVFNEPYLTWFEQGCIRSLLWPKNHAALRQAVAWDVWTTKKDAQRVKEIASRVGVPVNVDDSLTQCDRSTKVPLKANLLRALTSEMDRCAKENAAFFWIAPDSIFGDGTVASIFELSAPKDVCISFAPLRVNAEGFLAAMGGPLDNASLVRFAFTRLHQAFADAEATLPQTNSYDSGVSWRRIGEGLYAVTHRKHSAYLMQPLRGDWKWFVTMKKFGAYDHSLPTRLVDEQRQRIVGSSDAAFVVELTEPENHMAKMQPNDPAEPDRYWQDRSHHKVNRGMTVIWRAA